MNEYEITFTMNLTVKGNTPEEASETLEEILEDVNTKYLYPYDGYLDSIVDIKQI